MRSDAEREKHRLAHADWLSRNPGYAKQNRQKNYLSFLLNRARARARKDGREFDIDVRDISPRPTHCPVLGIELLYGTATRENYQDAAASLDRVDNSKGYVKGNVRIISRRANSLKSNATVEELQAIVGYMMAHAEQVKV